MDENVGRSKGLKEKNGKKTKSVIRLSIFSPQTYILTDFSFRRHKIIEMKNLFKVKMRPDFKCSFVIHYVMESFLQFLRPEPHVLLYSS